VDRLQEVAQAEALKDAPEEVNALGVGVLVVVGAERVAFLKTRAGPIRQPCAWLSRAASCIMRISLRGSPRS
jgi:hypothetical protein